MTNSGGAEAQRAVRVIDAVVDVVLGIVHSEIDAGTIRFGARSPAGNWPSISPLPRGCVVAAFHVKHVADTATSRRPRYFGVKPRLKLRVVNP